MILATLTLFQVIEDASEKVQLAEDSYSLVDKYMRKLDHELLKFKLELEADNRGITEILEKHSLEMDQPGLGACGINLKENRHPKKHVRNFGRFLARTSNFKSVGSTGIFLFIVS